MDRNFEQARAFFQDGLAHYQAGRMHEAERGFAAALDLMPGRPSVLTNLGAVRLKLGRPEEAVALLQEALLQEPENTEALGHCGAARAELGQPQAALALFDRALAKDASLASLWTLRGSVLKELGRLDEAAASFRTALEHGGDAALNRYYLAGLAREPAPPGPPAHYVQQLFDGYAAHFDSHLVQELHYEAPRILMERVALAGRRYGYALDLGCGTGLCGPYLKRMAAHVTGVDLSANMLDKAQATGAYDTLLQAEAVAYLAAAQERFELAVAADVFIYVGALEEVFRHLGRLMPAGGCFCFTVEESDGVDVQLRASLRYAHSEAYLRRLAQENGFSVSALERRPVRHDQRVPIPGLFVWMEK